MREYSLQNSYCVMIESTSTYAILRVELTFGFSSEELSDLGELSHEEREKRATTATAIAPKVESFVIFIIKDFVNCVLFINFACKCTKKFKTLRICVIKDYCFLV